jgi:allophanate hydrolase subunit 1
VYPRSTPGGWRLLGLTDFALFDVGAPSPARLGGDQVKFVSR